MGAFFKGWRRKVGALTLALACLFLAGWVRSLSTCDFVSFFSSDRQALHDLSSTRMGLMYMLTRHDFTTQTKTITFETRPWNLPPGMDYLSYVQMNWKLDWCGFRFGHSFQTTNDITGTMALVIPYWSIVIPLTAISAYLLLCKPRPAKMQITQPSQPGDV